MSLKLPSNQYVGTNPEVGGSSPFQMLSGDKRVQVINPSSAITVRLPTTSSVKQGDVVELHSQAINIVVTVQSSDGSAIDQFSFGYIKCIALRDNPITASHWHILEINDHYETSTTSGIGAAGGGSLNVGTLITITGRRFGSGPSTSPGSRTIQLWVRLNGGCTGTVTEVGYTLPTRFCVSSASYRTGTFCTPESNGMGRIALEETGLNFRIFNNLGSPQSFPASFDFKHTISVTRY